MKSRNETYLEKLEHLRKEMDYYSLLEAANEALRFWPAFPIDFIEWCEQYIKNHLNVEQFYTFNSKS